MLPSSTGGIVLCGGRSRRMQMSKALLPFGPETMLARVVRRLSEAVGPVVVVAAAGQPLPELPSGTLLGYDRRRDRGPLEGLAVGLHTLADRAEAVFLTGCDAPLLGPAFVRRMVELAAGFDIAVPQVDGFDHPLAAVYSRGVLPQVEALLAADRLRPAFLFDQVRTRRVTAAELAEVDRQLEGLTNVNTPADYQAALERAGLPRVDRASG